MDNNEEKNVRSEELKNDAENISTSDEPKITLISDETDIAEPVSAEGTEEAEISIDTPTSEPDDSLDTHVNGALDEEEPISDHEKSGDNGAYESEPTPEAEENDEDVAEQIVIDIPDTTLSELAYDDDASIKADDAETTAGFADFLASYRKQVSDMLKSNRPADGDGDGIDENQEKDEEDYSAHLPALNYSDTDDQEDDKEAIQLTIDPAVVPFTPLKESEKKEERNEKAYSYDPKKPGFINNLFDIFEIFVFTVAAVLLVSSFLFRHSEVEGGSMDNTLADGEHLIISDLFYTPKRGDIIVFEDYSLSKKIPIVKRVIGIEGDTVKIDNENGVSVVYLNGERLEEDYALTDDYDMHPSGEWTVGEGEVFVLGDHRNVSWDGRSFGTIDEDSILGKVVLRFFPFDRFGTVQ